MAPPGEPHPGARAGSGPDPRLAVRPEVRALSAYRLEPPPAGVAVRHELDQNEVPWDLPPRLKRRIAERLAARPWNRYPDFHGDALRRTLGERWGWPAEGVLVGNGSNELLGVVLETVAGPGAEVLGAVPSFGLYPAFAVRSGARYRPLGPRADLALPLAELEREIDRDPRRPLLLASPNNPTGEAATPEAVARLAGRLEAPLLLDNAYGEFCRHDYRPLLDRHPNLVLFRTFSKAWSLAGLRLGYLLARPELVAELVKLKLPYNLGWAGIEAGCAALEEVAALGRRVRVLVARRERWAAMLAGFGLEVFPSEANFLLVRCGEGGREEGDPAREGGVDPGRGGAVEAARGSRARRAELGVEVVWRGLAERGIVVRRVDHYPGLAGCLRITIAGGAAQRAVAAALAEILGRTERHQEIEESREEDQDQERGAG